MKDTFRMSSGLLVSCCQMWCAMASGVTSWPVCIAWALCVFQFNPPFYADAEVIELCAHPHLVLFIHGFEGKLFFPKFGHYEKALTIRTAYMQVTGEKEERKTQGETERNRDRERDRE